MIYDKFDFPLPAIISSERKYNKSLLTIYIIIFVLPLLYIAGTLRPAIADYYFGRTINAASKNYDIAQSINFMNKAITLDPGNAEYPYHLGRLYYDKYVQASKFNLQTRSLHLIYAMNEYKKAVNINPLNSKYRQSLAWGYGQLAGLSVGKTNLVSMSYKDNHRNAVKEFGTAIKLDPNNPYPHRLYAIWLYRHSSKEYIDKADSEYKTAISLKPELIVEAVGYSKKANGKLFDIKKLIPDNKQIIPVIVARLKKAGYKKEAEGIALSTQY